MSQDHRGRHILEPVSVEKDELLWLYVEQWRKAYGSASRIANRLEGPVMLRKLAASWHRHHRFPGQCEHSPRCKSIYHFFQQVRDSSLAKAKTRAWHARPEQHIGWLSFNHAWFKGFSNRRSHPSAYRQMAIIPRELVSYRQGYLILRLLPFTELLFEMPDEPELPGTDSQKAVILYCRDVNMNRQQTCACKTSHRSWLLQL